MTNLRSLTAMAALGAVLAMPAFAQTNSGPTANSGPTTNTPATSTGAMTAPAATITGSTAATRSDDTTGSNDVRASKVIGASVYNDHNEKIGTIDDLLMNRSHDVTQVVLSVGGFLGVDSKLVAVSIDKLQVRPDRIVMAGATKDGLTKMPTYKFANSAS